MVNEVMYWLLPTVYGILFIKSFQINSFWPLFIKLDVHNISILSWSCATKALTEWINCTKILHHSKIHFASLMQKWAIFWATPLLISYATLNWGNVHLLQLYKQLWNVVLEWIRNSLKPSLVWGKIIWQELQNNMRLVGLMKSSLDDTNRPRTWRSVFWWRNSDLLQVWSRKIHLGFVCSNITIPSRHFKQLSSPW